MAMDLHEGETVIFEGHPSWRAMLTWYFKGLLLAVLAGLIALLVTGIGGDSSTGAAVTVALVALGIVLLIGFLKRLATVYSITNQRLRIKRGIIARHVQQTRIDRVQNVNTDQGVLERVLMVGTVDFDTAGTEDSDFQFQGVADPAAVVEAVDRAQATGSGPPGGQDPQAAQGL